MTKAAKQPKSQTAMCLHCGGATVTDTLRGRPRLYCSQACRQKAYRARQEASSTPAAPAATGDQVNAAYELAYDYEGAVLAFHTLHERDRDLYPSLADHPEFEQLRDGRDRALEALIDALTR